jgi:hypothetical protein
MHYDREFQASEKLDSESSHGIFDPCFMYSDIGTFNYSTPFKVQSRRGILGETLGFEPFQDEFLVTLTIISVPLDGIRHLRQILVETLRVPVGKELRNVALHSMVGEVIERALHEACQDHRVTGQASMHTIPVRFEPVPDLATSGGIVSK